MVGRVHNLQGTNALGVVLIGIACIDDYSIEIDGVLAIGSAVSNLGVFVLISM